MEKKTTKSISQKGLHSSVKCFLCEYIDIKNEFSMTEDAGELAYKFAYQFIQKQKYEQATGFLLILSLMFPENKKYIWAFANTLVLLEEYESAILIYEHMISKGMTENRLFFAIGECSYRMRDMVKAKDFLGKYITLINKISDIEKKSEAVMIKQATLMLSNI